MHSPEKALKEASMKGRFEERFETELEKIKVAISRKGGVKAFDKVNRRIGRIAEKYPSVNKYYTVEVSSDTSGKNDLALYFDFKSHTLVVISYAVYRLKDLKNIFYLFGVFRTNNTIQV